MHSSVVLTTVCLQEYIGTVGADYIQYMITDPVASPRKYEQFYSEKFIWLPSSFLATSMAYLQPHMQPPSVAASNPGALGCGGAAASFVYCNFNKQLKFDPHVFSQWLHILQEVPDSVLCLLENPKDSIPFIRSFVADIDPGLTSRVRFLRKSLLMLFIYSINDQANILLILTHL